MGRGKQSLPCYMDDVYIFWKVLTVQYKTPVVKPNKPVHIFHLSNGEYVPNRSFDFSGRQCNSWDRLQRNVHLPLSWNDFYRGKSRGSGGASYVHVSNKQWILCVLWLFGWKPVYVEHVIHGGCAGELRQRTPSLLLQWHSASRIRFCSGRSLFLTNKIFITINYRINMNSF